MAHSLFLLLFLTTTAFAQIRTTCSPADDFSSGVEGPILASTDKFDPAGGAMKALKRLDKLLLNHESLGEFEANRKLARVSFETFNKELESVTVEVECLVGTLPQSRLKVAITNALYSYRDGAFWWSRIDQSRVINASAFTSIETTTPSDTAFASTIPSTTAIHWRQARKYLRNAEALMGPK